MISPKYPTLYQVNTRIRDVIQDCILDYIRCDWIYLLGVWETGKAGREVSLKNAAWRDHYHVHLPDFREEDVCGSPFAVKEYKISNHLGGFENILRFKKKLNNRGSKLMLDFVPNHTAPDHPWVTKYTDYYITGSQDDLLEYPDNYTQIQVNGESIVMAYGRDPYFSGWPDTLQLNYGNNELQEAMIEEMLKIAKSCDGLRVDMAMLLLPDVFERTWGVKPDPFWERAIRRVKDIHPDFCFLAEVYWDMEWDLQQMGFDFTYDKRLYDRLLDKNPSPVRDHLKAEATFQNKLCRFLENHDEERIASTLDRGPHEASAIVAFLSPGMRFFHDGQLDGRKIKTSIHLCRRIHEEPDIEIKKFYEDLLSLLSLEIMQEGTWELISPEDFRMNNGNPSNLIAFHWSHKQIKILVFVNLSNEICNISVIPDDLHSIPELLLSDDKNRLNDNFYLPLKENTLNFDLSAWGYKIIRV